jgi:type VI secretion system Hcp family effector
MISFHRSLSSVARGAVCCALLALTGTARVSAHGFVTAGMNEQPPLPARIQIMIPGVGVGLAESFGFDQQLRQPGSSGPGSVGGAGRGELSSFSVIKQLDALSPRLFQMLLSGEHLQRVTINLIRPAGSANGAETIFFTINLNDVTITASHARLPKQDDPATKGAAESEQVTFSAASIDWTYYTPTGERITTGWDFKTNKKI